MKKKYKRRSKRKNRIGFALAIIIILAISTVSVLILYNPNNLDDGDGTQQPDNIDNGDGTQEPDNTTNSTIPDQTIPTILNFPNITLNKHIPSNYTMGLTSDGGLETGMDAIFISDSNEKVSIRFTAKLSGTVSNLTIYGSAYEGDPIVRIGLQNDDNGDPSGIWIQENSFKRVQFESSSGFITVQFDTPIFLNKEQVYHIVIEADNDTFNGTALLRAYKNNSLAQPFNSEDPDIVWNDPQMNILTFDGNNWNPQNKWPIFVIEYSDDSFEGQPYSLCAQWVVWGSTWVGQSLVPASDYEVEKIAFDVSIGKGNAQDKLHYQIRDTNNEILAEGLFADSSQLTTAQTWIEVTLDSPVILRAGKHYRIILLSPETDFDNSYYLFGHEFCYEPLIGYGSLQHQLTSTHSGGESWSENKDADAIFKLTTSS